MVTPRSLAFLTGKTYGLETEKESVRQEAMYGEKDEFRFRHP